MKTFLSLSLAIACVIAVATSCIYDPQSGEVVLKESVCVTFDQYETSPNIAPRVICDKFREALLDKLDSYGATLDDVKDIRVHKAYYKVTELEGHDWTFAFRVWVERGDIDDGPRTLIRFKEQSLMGLKDVTTKAQLRGVGVQLLNRALDDLVAGGDPEVWIGLSQDMISPVPSAGDPLVFSWVACVEFQAIVDVSDYVE